MNCRFAIPDDLWEVEVDAAQIAQEHGVRSLDVRVQGPGAGPAVTAGGVFGDLLRLAAYLGARL